MKILHLSDLHIEDRDSIERTGQLFDAINKHYDKTESKPVIVITGDMVDCGNKKNYDQVKLLLAKLSDFHLLLCPGNHDFSRETLVLGDAGMCIHKGYIKNYQTILNQSIDFPVVTNFIEFPDYHFIGLNSMADVDDFGPDGKIGKAQLNRLEESIVKIKQTDPSNKIIVFLHHHPYMHLMMRLKDADELVDVIDDKVDVLLFGHKHVECLFNIKNIKVTHASGASSEYVSNSGGVNYFTVFEIDTDDFSVCNLIFLV